MASHRSLQRAIGGFLLKEDDAVPLFGRKSRGDQGSEDVEEARAAELMSRLFPTCPICGAKADYDVNLRLLGEHIQCKSCTAKWASPGSSLREGKKPDRLTLIKFDKEKRARALKGEEYGLSFWQDFKLDTYARSIKREVKRLAEGIQSAFANDADYEEPLEELQQLGINGLLEAIEIATGGKFSLSRQRAGCLLALGALGDKRGEEALVRALEDEDEEVRVVAAYSLVEFHKRTGSYDAVPSLTKRLENDGSALVRSRVAVFLSEVKGDERVIHALRRAVEDTGRPKGEESMASGSWVEFLSKAARHRIPPSVGDQAKWALEELGIWTGHSFKKGIKAFEAGQYDEAIAGLRKAIEVGGPDDQIGYCHKILGNAHLKKGSHREAIECQKKALEMDRADTQAWVNLGVTYRNADRLDDAEQCYQRALDIEPEYAKLHQSLGVLYILRGEPERGVRALERAIGLNPELPAAHGNLALAYAKTGQFKRARPSLMKARELGYAKWKVIDRMISDLRQE
jgi:tetratricopeptide (TPR) repeat protein